MNRLAPLYRKVLVHEYISCRTLRLQSRLLAETATFKTSTHSPKMVKFAAPVLQNVFLLNVCSAEEVADFKKKIEDLYLPIGLSNGYLVELKLTFLAFINVNIINK